MVGRLMCDSVMDSASLATLGPKVPCEAAAFQVSLTAASIPFIPDCQFMFNQQTTRKEERNDHQEVAKPSHCEHHIGPKH